MKGWTLDKLPLAIELETIKVLKALPVGYSAVGPMLDVRNKNWSTVSAEVGWLKVSPDGNFTNIATLNISFFKEQTR